MLTICWLMVTMCWLYVDYMLTICWLYSDYITKVVTISQSWLSRSQGTLHAKLGINCGCLMEIAIISAGTTPPTSNGAISQHRRSRKSSDHPNRSPFMMFSARFRHSLTTFGCLEKKELFFRTKSTHWDVNLVNPLYSSSNNYHHFWNHWNSWVLGWGLLSKWRWTGVTLLVLYRVLLELHCRTARLYDVWFRTLYVPLCQLNRNLICNKWLWVTVDKFHL